MGCVLCREKVDTWCREAEERKRRRKREKEEREERENMKMVQILMDKRNRPDFWQMPPPRIRGETLAMLEERKSKKQRKKEEREERENLEMVQMLLDKRNRPDFWQMPGPRVRGSASATRHATRQARRQARRQATQQATQAQPERRGASAATRKRPRSERRMDEPSSSTFNVPSPGQSSVSHHSDSDAEGAVGGELGWRDRVLCYPGFKVPRPKLWRFEEGEGDDYITQSEDIGVKWE